MKAVQNQVFTPNLLVVHNRFKKPKALQGLVFNSSYYQQREQNLLPNLHTYFDGFFMPSGSLSALEFVPPLSSVTLNDEDLASFLKNPESKHVLIDTEQVKMVLIKWAPGETYPVHGHAVGGCVFKVLNGTIRERRYSSVREGKLISENLCMEGNVSYIDDAIGFHDVANTTEHWAVSLHVYTRDAG